MNFQDYSFDERLAYAETLPSHWYYDGEILAVEQRRVFFRNWQLVGRGEQVAAPGQYFTATIGEEPIVVVRDGDEKLRAFSNVCRHRAGPVAAGAGKRSSFQCGYHGDRKSVV